MSWDLFAMKLPSDIRSLEELPEGFRESSIGARSEIFATLLTFPNSRDSGQGYINIETQTYAIEISIGEGEVCTGIMFYVYGDGAGAAPVIQKISERLGVRTWDISGWQFLDGAADPTSGFRRHKEYRDHVLKIAGADEKR